jgi:hypothetical protein
VSDYSQTDDSPNHDSTHDTSHHATTASEHISVKAETKMKKPTTTKRPRWRLKMYGFPMEHSWAQERACALWGAAKTEDDAINKGVRYSQSMKSASLFLWRRTRLRAVLMKSGIVLAISLAENTSESETILPPREVIDKIKALLETNEEPAWYNVYA